MQETKNLKKIVLNYLFVTLYVDYLLKSLIITLFVSFDLLACSIYFCCLEKIML